jgi:Subtilase family/CARDB
MKTHEFILKLVVVMMATICPVTVLSLPNLAPYQPAGWSDKIVVSTTTGTTTDSPSFSTTDSLYLDWAVINNGDTGTGGSFYTALYVDGAYKTFWIVSALDANTYSTVTDYALGSLTAGTHTLTITNDWIGMITESSKADNGYTKTIVVSPPAQPNLTPYQPPGWSDKIVVSTVTGTTTNSPLITPTDTVYVDWAVINNGSAPTAARFYSALYVDSSLKTSWYSDPPLGTNAYVHVNDYSIGSFSLGPHTLMLITDSTSTITETNELDNIYTRQFTVSPPPQPNLAPYQPPGWSDKVVISTNAGATIDMPSPTTSDTLYAAWAVGNIGTAAVSNSFSTTLSVDGVLRNTWTNAPPLAPSSYVSITNFLIGSLNVGLHTVALATDTGSTVPESNESDNSYTKLLAILQAPPAVQTLAATSIVDTSAQLQAWIDPHSGAGYAWFDYGTTTNYGSTTSQQSLGTTVTNMHFNLTGLTAETSYHYRAVAYNGGGTNRGADVAFTTLGPQIRIEPLTLTFSIAGSGSGSSAMAGSPSVTQSAAAAEMPVALPQEQKLLYPDDITSGFAKGPTVAVTVNLSLPQNTRAATDFASAASLKVLQTNVHAVQREVLDNIPAKHLKLRHRFENIAGFSAEVTVEGLRALQANPRVVSIEPVYILEPHLAQSIPLAHGMTYRSAYNGAGLSIAICDTGIDYNHPRLGGGGFPNSKILGGYDFGDNDADPIPNTQAHGTCCAGIAAGDLGTVGDYIGGVAYNAKLYALKITSGTGGSCTTDAEEASWDWCVTHRNDNPDYPIMVISMSFGGGRYLSPCDNELPSMTAVASNAIAAGITVLVSSGNDGYCDSIGFPACLSSVISVGAVFDASFGHITPCVNAASCAPKIATSGCASGYYADDVSAPDKVTAYSNMSDFLSLLAPGDELYTTDIVGSGGISSGDYDETFSGTSAACPFAAGSVACLQSAAKARTGSYLTPQEVKSILVASGDPVTDTKVAITQPRVNLERAIQSLPDRSQTFRIYNDGAGKLTITSITPETNAPWIHFVPAVPFDIPAPGYQDVSVVVDTNQAPAGQTTIRLLVASNDADRSPYPGGVYVQTVRPAQIVLNGMGLSNGIFHFVLNGPAGSNCVVQASSNLFNWWPIVTNTIPGGGSLLVTDPGMTNHSLRFYRVRMP